MKAINYPLVLILLFIFSCDALENKGNVIPDQRVEYKNELPQILEDDDSIISRYSSSRESIVDEIYWDQVEKQGELQELYNSLDFYDELRRNKEEITKDYFFKNSAYYSETEALSASIKNEVIKNYVSGLLRASQSNYLNEVSEQNELLEQIDTLGTSISDYQIALKIAVTLPVIHEFQKQKNPNTAGLNEVIELQHSLIKMEEDILKSQNN